MGDYDDANDSLAKQSGKGQFINVYSMTTAQRRGGNIFLLPFKVFQLVWKLSWQKTDYQEKKNKVLLHMHRALTMNWRPKEMDEGKQSLYF